MNYPREYTPKGYLVVKHDKGPFSPGQTVKVITKGNHLDLLFEGTVGTFLGYSVAHGFACVSHDGTENFFHPESLEMAS